MKRTFIKLRKGLTRRARSRPMSVKRRSEREHSILAFVRSLRCCVHGCITWNAVVDPHHVKTRGAGGEDIGNVVPLCRVHHTMVHTVGRTTFEKMVGTDLMAEALCVTAMFKMSTISAPGDL